MKFRDKIRTERQAGGTLADIFEKLNEKQKLNNKNYEKIADYCFNILTSKLWSKY